MRQRTIRSVNPGSDNGTVFRAYLDQGIQHGHTLPGFRTASLPNGGTSQHPLDYPGIKQTNERFSRRPSPTPCRDRTHRRASKPRCQVEQRTVRRRLVRVCDVLEKRGEFPATEIGLLEALSVLARRSKLALNFLVLAETTLGDDPSGNSVRTFFKAIVWRWVRPVVSSSPSAQRVWALLPASTCSERLFRAPALHFIPPQGDETGQFQHLDARNLPVEIGAHF